MLRNHSNLGMYVDRTFENFEVNRNNREAFNFTRRWANAYIANGQVEKGLFLYGGTGVGKTHLACAVANRLIDSGIFTRFIRAVDVPRDDTDAVLELADETYNPVLVLDDIGTAKLTDRYIEVQYLLIDGRLWRQAPMIITSNHNPDRLRKFMNAASPEAGERIVSRLFEACHHVPMFGKDRRRNKTFYSGDGE